MRLKTQKIMICGEGISDFDSAGALALIKCVDESHVAEFGVIEII